MKDKTIKVLKFLKTNIISTVLVLVLATSGTVLAANIVNKPSDEVVANIEETTQQETTAVNIIQEEMIAQGETTFEENVTESLTEQQTTATIITQQTEITTEVPTEKQTETPKFVNAENAKYFTYTLVGGGNNIYITGYTGNESNVIIPSMIDGYNVTGIADDTSGAFSGNLNITSIIFPEGLTYLGACTCRACHNLISVTLPQTLTTIKHGSFLGCDKLDSLIIPSSVVSIDSDGTHMFYKSIPTQSSDPNPKNITITLIVENNSYAMKYAIEHNVDYLIK